MNAKEEKPLMFNVILGEEIHEEGMFLRRRRESIDDTESIRRGRDYGDNNTTLKM